MFVADHAFQSLAFFDRYAFEFVAVTRRVFTAFAGVAFAADAVHGDSQRGVCLGADGAQRHGAGGKAFDDIGSRFDLVQRYGFGRIDFEFEQTAQRHVAAALVVDDLRVLFVGGPVVAPGAVLQFGNRVRCPHVVFAACAPSVFAAGVQHGGQHRVVAERTVVHADGFFGDLKNTYALHAAGRAGEIFVNRFAVDTDGLKQLRAAVRHVSGHAHLGHDFGQSFADGFDVVVNRFVSRQITGQAFVQLSQRFHGQIRMNGFCAIACKHRKVMHFAGAAGFDDQACAGAQTFFDQMLVHSR